MKTSPDIASPVDRAPNAPVPPRIAPVLITREGEQALRRELATLRREVEVELPRRLRRAREFGEAAGNDDLLQLREEEAVTSARINGLLRILATAKIVEPDARNGGVAAVGSLVELRIGGETIERRLLGSHEPVGSDGMSVASPIGRAVVGHPAGVSVVAEMPGGRMRTIGILAVDGRRSPSAELPAAA